jgi:AmmeMemoRadiSam system protein A
VDRLTGVERTNLLRLARGSIRQALHSDDSLTRLLDVTEVTAGLERPSAAFVSLKQPDPKGGRALLRGCIGNMHASLPLYRNVIEMAPKAALEDPRFPPLRSDELADLRIEISALGPARPIAGVEDLVIGRHGVELASGGAQAVFLPQVATELGWSAEELLRQLSRKAGLGVDAWRDAELSVFEADVFGE